MGALRYRLTVRDRLNTRLGLRWLNETLELCAASGLPGEQSVRLFRTFGYYLNGAILDETAGYARGPSTIEPVPDAFARLSAHYAPHSQVTTLNMAVSDTSGTLPFYQVANQAPEWCSMLSSFDRDTIVKHAGIVPDIESHIEQIAVASAPSNRRDIQSCSVAATACGM